MALFAVANRHVVGGGAAHGRFGHHLRRRRRSALLGSRIVEPWAHDLIVVLHTGRVLHGVVRVEGELGGDRAIEPRESRSF